ncbi:MAG: class I SAM-dependent methyltransferase [Gammaproteobacteria bacterium]|nr:class I SAM-dependent methyltransferase [Gammaproteobacteria bacterium]
MSGKLSDKQRLRIQTRHKVSIQNYGYQPQALFWSNQEIQELRFQKLLEFLPDYIQVGGQEMWSLLDVGCGFADFYRYFQRHDLTPDYTGIDLSPDMVAGALALSKNLNIQVGELADFDYADNQFDFVMLSGALNEVVETEIEGTLSEQGNYAKSVISKMYQISKFGIAFNLLDRRYAWHQSRPDLQSFYPDEMLEFCQSFADEVVLIEGYLENDFTLYLTKTERSA